MVASQLPAPRAPPRLTMTPRGMGAGPPPVLMPSLSIPIFRYLTTSGTAFEVPSLVMHPWRPGVGLPAPLCWPCFRPPSPAWDVLEGGGGGGGGAGGGSEGPPISSQALPVVPAETF